jgi:hypothetical protein
MFLSYIEATILQFATKLQHLVTEADKKGDLLHIYRFAVPKNPYNIQCTSESDNYRRKVTEY